MEPILRAYKLGNKTFNLDPLPVRREWMDNTPEKHAYHCYPVTTANTVGWYLSCPEDITFIWNGVIDTTDKTVDIIKGKDWAYTGRGQASLSMHTNLILKSNENISVLAINPPNFFSKGFEVISSLMSTSFYPNEFPIAIQANIANEEITIPAGTPIAAILPISLSSMKDAFIEIDNFITTPEYFEAQRNYGNASFEQTKDGNWTNWYRDGVNEKGEKVGNHEVKHMRLSVVDKTKKDN